MEATSKNTSALTAKILVGGKEPIDFEGGPPIVGNFIRYNLVNNMAVMDVFDPNSEYSTLRFYECNDDWKTVSCDYLTSYNLKPNENLDYVDARNGIIFFKTNLSILGERSYYAVTGDDMPHLYFQTIIESVGSHAITCESQYECYSVFGQDGHLVVFLTSRTGRNLKVSRQADITSELLDLDFFDPTMITPNSNSNDSTVFVI